MDVLLVADVAGEVLDAHGEVVDVHLEADCDDAVTELQGQAGAACATRALILAGLAQQLELDQLADEARDGSARQTRLCGDTGARARLALGNLLQHDPEIRPPDGRLIRTRGCSTRALEAHARVPGRGDVGSDVVNPAADFVLPSYKLRPVTANVKTWSRIERQRSPVPLPG